MMTVFVWNPYFLAAEMSFHPSLVIPETRTRGVLRDNHQVDVPLIRALGNRTNSSTAMREARVEVKERHFSCIVLRDIGVWHAV
jgi:hypothetical protein